MFRYTAHVSGIDFVLVKQPLMSGSQGWRTADSVNPDEIETDDISEEKAKEKAAWLQQIATKRETGFLNIQAVPH